MSDSSALPKSCPKCGTDLPSEATEGLCPRCLMAEAMQPTGPKTPAGPWQPPSAVELQKLLPQYEITALLGRGGMGAVYKGTQIALDRPVVIKILSNQLEEADTSFAERFKNEARALGKLSHPGIVGVYDFGEAANGLLYIVMEFIDGTDVSRMIAKQKRLHTEHAMAITAHVCDALAYAHERGIIHRDIKPANIMVGYDGVVKVADFGLAKMSTGGESVGFTQTGMAMGTLHYMAPEALMLGTAVDHRADIYAVGVMLYQMLTGKLPQGMFELPSLQVAGLDPRYDGIIAKALRDDRELRYQRASEMRFDLDHILTQPVVKVEPDATQAPAALPTAARPQRPAGQPYRPPQVYVPPPKPKSAVVGTLAWLTLIVVLMGGGYYWMKSQQAKTDVPAASTSSASPAEATEDRPFVNSLGMKFVPVPGTDVLFCIHETRYRDYAAYAAEVVGVNAKWENQITAGFTPAERAEDHPVWSVNWDDAQAFCAWLSKKEGKTYRLPTDKEWSYAVGIGADEKWKDDTTPATVIKNQKVFPWGDAWPPPKGVGNYSDLSRNEKAPNKLQVPYLDGYDDGFPTTAPVMSFKPNKLGLYDISGNAWEWCEDWFDTSKTERVLRGSSWWDSGGLQSSNRIHRVPDDRGINYGFRCVLQSPATVAETKPDIIPKPIVPAPATAGPAPSTKQTAPTPPAPLTGLDLQLAQLEQSFQAAVERDAGSAFKAAVTKLNAGYSRALDAAIATATKSALLDDVVQLKEEQAAMTKLPAAAFPPPDDAKTPAALKALRTTYRNAIAQYTTDYAKALVPLYEKYDQTLTALQAEQTRASKIPEALRIKTMVEIMRQWRSTVLAKAAAQPGSTIQQVLARGPDKIFLSAPTIVTRPSFPLSVPDTPSVAGEVVLWRLDGKPLDESDPINQIPRGLDDVVQVALGDFAALALKKNGTVIAWGGDQGCLCRQIPVGLNDVVDVQSRSVHAIALRRDGTVTEWGYGPSELRINPPGCDRAVAIKVGFWLDMLLSDEGKVFMIGKADKLQYYGMEVPQNLDRVVSIANGASWACALRQDGQIINWGGDNPAQKGFGPPPVNANAHAFFAVPESPLGFILDGTGKLREWGDAKKSYSLTSNGLVGQECNYFFGYPKKACLQDNAGRWYFLSETPLDADHCATMSAGLIKVVLNPNYALGIKPAGSKAAVVLPSAVAPTVSSAASTMTATNAKPITNTLGMQFVPVPGTNVLFCIHETRRQDYAAFAAENSGVNSEWKNATWKGQSVSTANDHPVVNVSPNEAQLFCAWLSKKEKRTYRLPTDLEWSHAVGIGTMALEDPKLTPEERIPSSQEFPWGSKRYGNYLDTATVALFGTIGGAGAVRGYDDGYATTAPVMKYPPNKLGLYDMGGNVSEICPDWFNAAKDEQVNRGGNWLSFGPGFLMSAYRGGGTKPDGRDVFTGFRVVMESSSSTAAASLAPPPAVVQPVTAVASATVTATKDKPFTNTLGMKFVPVPDTKVLFCIHETRRQDYAAYAATSSGVDGGWTRQQKDGIPAGDKDDHPVVGVSWDDVNAFCSWLSKKEGRAYRLPTDEEWSYAVGIGDMEKRTKDTTPEMLQGAIANVFPWGSNYPPRNQDQAGNYNDTAWHEKFPSLPFIEGYKDGFATTAPVMSFKPNKLGLYDLGGNVWEWCEDWHNAQQHNHVLRGGSWGVDGATYIRSSSRIARNARSRYENLGFRVVLELPAP